MRASLKIIACLTAMAVLFSSCSKVIRSHRSFMDGLKTKADVNHYFGYPGQYLELADTTRWLYDLGEQRRINRHNPNPVKATHPFQGSKRVRTFDYSKKYLEVTFKNDSVVYHQIAGANYTLRKPQPLKTVLLVVGVLVIGIGIMLLTYEPFLDPIVLDF